MCSRSMLQSHELYLYSGLFVIDGSASQSMLQCSAVLGMLKIFFFTVSYLKVGK